MKWKCHLWIPRIDKIFIKFSFKITGPWPWFLPLTCEHKNIGQKVFTFLMGTFFETHLIMLQKLVKRKFWKTIERRASKNILLVRIICFVHFASISWISQHIFCFDGWSAEVIIVDNYEVKWVLNPDCLSFIYRKESK